MAANLDSRSVAFGALIGTASVFTIQSLRSLTPNARRIKKDVKASTTTRGEEKLPPLPELLATANGAEWLRRRKAVQALLLGGESTMLDFIADKPKDLAGVSNYASRSRNDVANETQDEEPAYVRVSASEGGWQTNWARAWCDVNGKANRFDHECHGDDAMFRAFYSQASRQGAAVLDVGCNTGRNMTLAKQYGGARTTTFGIEYSACSAEIARAMHGTANVITGDASENFVDANEWEAKFSVVQCNAVVQHLPPEKVRALIGHASRCLSSGGEFMLTFKDAPTVQYLTARCMGQWASEIVTADCLGKAAHAAYRKDGCLRATMWDDDYYPGVASDSPPPHTARHSGVRGMHIREFVFYSLDWMIQAAASHGLIAEAVEAQPDAKIPLGVMHWLVVFRKNE